MASVTWQGLTGFVQQQIAALQSAANAVIDATVGSVSLAWAQAVGGVSLYLQALVVNALALTRFATSYGSDADSWGAQWGFNRLGATYATSTETFSRNSTTQQATIAGGTLVNGVPTGGALISTGPGGVQFMVMADPTNAAWNATLGAFVLAVGVSTVTVPITCTTPGTAGNVLANTIQSFVTAIPYVDSCTNPSNIINGDAAEPDPNYKARFPIWLNGLASADLAAIQSAVVNTQQGLTFKTIENQDYPGLGTDNGSFFVLVNDGSGNPPSSLLTLVSNAVNAIRAGGVRFQGAYGPSVITPTIALVIRVASGYTSGAVVAAVQAAIVAAVNATPLAAGTLFISTIVQAALSVPGCAAVEGGGNTKINGTAADLSMTVLQLPMITSSNVSVGTY